MNAVDGVSETITQRVELFFLVFERARCQAKSVMRHTDVYGFDFEMPSLFVTGKKIRFRHTREEAKKSMQTIDDILAIQEGLRQYTS